MTDKAVSALTSLTGSGTATGDLLYIVDISEASAADRSKKITAQELQNYIKGFPATIGVGGATPAASGAGISFPATISASSDANTLDDYEEGTWTPTATFATPGTVSTANAVGRYTKVGNVVTAVGRIAITKGTASGDLVLGGLPFASNNTSAYQVAGTLSTDTFGVAGTLYQMLLAPNATVPEALAVTQSTGVTNAVTASDFYAGAGTLRFVFTYQV